MQGVREHTEGSGEVTGIERLQGMSMAFRGYTWGASLSETLGDIAGQIKREHAEGCFRMGERAAEDAEAIAWVREHGGVAYVRDAWKVRSNLDRQLEKERAKVERQQRHIEFVQRKCRERQERVAELSSMFREADYRRVELCSALGIDPGTGWADAMVAMHQRLMPEGMEWPRFEDGEAVRPGDKPQDKDGDWFEAVSFVFTCDWWSIRGYQTEGFGDLNDKTRRTLEGMAYGTRVKRPAPKVLDADGVEIRVGDTVWVTIDNPHGAPLLKGNEVTVRFVPHDIVHVEDKEGATWHVGSNDLTHERPDSWERLEEDAAKTPCVYFDQSHGCGGCPHYPSECHADQVRDIVLRAKALAGDA